MKKDNFILFIILTAFIYFSLITFYLPLAKAEPLFIRDFSYAIALTFIIILLQKILKREKYSENCSFEDIKMPRSSAEFKERMSADFQENITDHIVKK